MKQTPDVSGLLYQMWELLDTHFKTYPYKASGAKKAGTKRLSAAEKEASHALQATRGNYEFGGGSLISKTFRHMFRAQLKGFNNKTFNGRITKVFEAAIKLGEGDKGMRSAQLVRNREGMKAFLFHKRYIFRRIFREPMSTGINRRRTKVTLSIPAFRPVLLEYTAKATHVQFRLMAGIVSDLVFDGKEKKYVPLQTEHHGFMAEAHSDFQDLNAEWSSPVLLRATLPAASDSAIVLLAEIQFFEQINHKMYPMTMDHGMMVAEVY